VIKSQHPLQELAAEIAHFYRHGERIGRDMFHDVSYNDLLAFRFLETGGKTVSELARLRHVARQTMSQTVEDWVANDLICFADNPRHKKAKLLLLTEKSEELLRSANSRELQFIRRIEHRFDLTEVKTAVAVIRKLHCVMDAGQCDDR
jgi:DNA-binding MarR family transcriptional regulator